MVKFVCIVVVANKARGIRPLPLFLGLHHLHSTTSMTRLSTEFTQPRYFPGHIPTHEIHIWLALAIFCLSKSTSKFQGQNEAAAHMASTGLKGQEHYNSKTVAHRRRFWEERLEDWLLPNWTSALVQPAVPASTYHAVVAMAQHIAAKELPRSYKGASYDERLRFWDDVLGQGLELLTAAPQPWGIWCTDDRWN